MTTRAKVLLACAVAMGLVYVIFFSNWFRKDSIQIIPQFRPRASAIPRPRDWAPVYQVTFRFNQRYRFTSIKVVNAAQYATNQLTPALWHLVSDTGSAPQNAFVYGIPKIPGMRTAVARMKPQPLEAGVEYTLLIEAGKLKTQTNFVAREFVPKGSR